jgi:hypothetical protein
MKKISTTVLILSLLVSCTKEKKTLFKVMDSSQTSITFNNKITETEEFNVLTDEYIFNGGGVAAADFNNDGTIDLFFTGNQVSNRLYLNQGAFSFKDTTEESGLISNDYWSTAVAAADINGDGWQDLYVCTAMLEGKKSNKLYINEGADKDGVPRFVDSTESYNLVNDKNSMGALFFDYDKDGLLDLYVLNNEQEQFSPTNYRDKIIDGTAKSTDQLYRNTGDNRFEDVSLKAGVTIEGFGLGIAATDINKDGWIDLYISNDYLTNDVLYINQGDGTFKNKIDDYFKHQSKFSMGSDVNDFNNDGVDDLITVDMLGETNYRKKTTIGKMDYQDYVHNEQWDYEYQHSRNMLHKGNSNGVPYSEIGMMAGVYQTDWSWSPLFMDANNDGYKDLFITNGFPRDITDLDFINFKFEYRRIASTQFLLDSMPSVKIPNYAYQNIDSYQFKNSTKDWGINIPSFSNGAVYADLDNDGDLDYVVNNINDQAFVFKNTTRETDHSSYLKVRLKGPKTNFDGIGAQLKLTTADGSSQFYNQFLTRGFMSSVDPRVHFGLGTNQTINSLEVLWPDGKKQQLENLNANQLVELDYNNAVEPIKEQDLARATIFEEISNEINVNFSHSETDFNDFNIQRLIHKKLSQYGPCLAIGDFNGDGLEDFVLGSNENLAPTIYFQNRDQSFETASLFENENYTDAVEECIRPIDIDNNGLMDLIVSSKSNYYLDQKNYIVLNQGSGSFSIQDANELFEGSVIAVGDYNADGYEDVFIGGSPTLGTYPSTTSSKLLINHQGELKDSNNSIISDIEDMGMVTDAIWADLNNDQLLDLVVVAEFEPIKIYLHTPNGLERFESDLDQYKGLWNSIKAFDNDGDGDLDLIAGNIGANNYMHLSHERPITLVVDDFDQNGSLDPILFTYEKDKDSIYKAFPYAFKDNLVGQSPRFRKQFKLYKEFAQTDINEFFSKEELSKATLLEANFELSIYIENLGSNKYSITPLPQEAQIAPLTDIAITDFNLDSYPDIILVGNDYRYEPFVGRLDASNGLLLRGSGTHKFEAITASESGIVIPKDGREIQAIKTASGQEHFIVTQNRDQLLIYSKQ